MSEKEEVRGGSLKGRIEAILFVAGEAVSLKDMAKALTVGEKELKSALEDIGSEYDYTGEQRLNGYLDALHQSGLAASRQLIKMRYPSREWGYHAARELFGLKRPPTAVFCANDTIAAGVVNFCADRGIGIPEELSVIGFGNTPTAEYLNLNSVSQNQNKISGAICTNLRNLLNGAEIPPLTMIPTTYVARKTVQAPRAGVRKRQNFPSSPDFRHGF